MNQGERVAYYQGSIVPEREVLIPFRDAGSTRAEGAYDSARTFGGVVFRLREHLQRLERSLQYLRIDLPIPMRELESISLEIARQNYLIVGGDVWVTQRVTRGVPREWGGDGQPLLIVESLPIPFAARARSFRDGVRLMTSTLRRTPPWAISPQAKTLNLLNLTLGAGEVHAIDPRAWPILTDENGNLAEGAGANVFAVLDGTLVTPRRRYVLAGITRQVVMDLARAAGIPVEERDIDLYEAYVADELFITSTSLCICPVSDINGRSVRTPVPGPITRRMQEAFSALVGINVVRQYLDALPSEEGPVAAVEPRPLRS